MTTPMDNDSRSREKNILHVDKNTRGALAIFYTEFLADCKYETVNMPLDQKNNL